MPSFIVHYMPPHMDPSHSAVPAHSALLLGLARAQRWARASGVQEVKPSGCSAVFIDENIEGLFKYPSLWKLDFGLFLLCSIDNGSAAHFSDFATFAVEGPAADLVPEHVFDEQDASIEPQYQFVE